MHIFHLTLTALLHHLVKSGSSKMPLILMKMHTENVPVVLNLVVSCYFMYGYLVLFNDEKIFTFATSITLGTN